MDHLNISAGRAGHITDARDWKFSDVSMSIADGSAVALSDETNVTGIASKQAASETKQVDPAKKSFAEQDRNSCR